MANGLPPGIAASTPVTTFTEHVGQINATQAFFDNLAQQPDDGPIINLNFLRYRPRQDATVYNKYGVVAGREIGNVGGSMAHHAEVLQGIDPDFGFSADWDGVALPVYPRRASYNQLQRSVDYQGGIPDRVAGTFARLLYVLSDDEPLFDVTSSIAAMHESKKQISATSDNLVVSELLKFKGDDGVDDYRRYADAIGPLITEAGGAPILSVRAELPIVSQQYWDHFTLIRYPSLDAYGSLSMSDAWQEANGFRMKALERHLAVPGSPQVLPS